MGNQTSVGGQGQVLDGESQMSKGLDLLLGGNPGGLHPPAPLRRIGRGGLEPDDRHPPLAWLDAGTVRGQVVANSTQDLGARQQRGAGSHPCPPSAEVA